MRTPFLLHGSPRGSCIGRYYLISFRAQAKSSCPWETPVTLVSVTSSSCHCSDFQPCLIHLDPHLWAFCILLDWLMLLEYNALALLL